LAAAAAAAGMVVRAVGRRHIHAIWGPALAAVADSAAGCTGCAGGGVEAPPLYEFPGT
jgi:hypothetical protein